MRRAYREPTPHFGKRAYEVLATTNKLSDRLVESPAEVAFRRSEPAIERSRLRAALLEIEKAPSKIQKALFAGFQMSQRGPNLPPKEFFQPAKEKKLPATYL